MARINIEECWWSDPRRMKLIELVGTMIADGAALNAWRVAQEFWAKGMLVPKSIWQHVQANAKLIEANLAEERGDGVYVRGSSEYLSWVAERRAAAMAGGKKSAEKRSKKLKQTPTKRKQTQPSGSGSFSGSDSDSGSGGLASAPEVADTGEGLRREIWRAYSDAYFSRYKADPIRNKKTNSQIKQLAERLGVEAPDVVRYFLGHNKAYYVSKMHDIGACLSDAEALRTQWATGRKVTQMQAQQADSGATLEDQLARIRGGDL